MTRIRSSSNLPASVCMMFAVLALILKIAVPAGYMIAKEDAAFPLVLCTAQGAIVIDGAPDGPEAPDSHDSPCAFAGHGGSFVQPAAANGALFLAVSYPAPITPTAPDAAPGLGLAAPPLPARGPPYLI